MAQITVTQDGATVFVSNGDRVVIDIPDGGTVNIVAANSSVRNFRVDYGDNDTTANKVVIDTDSFERDRVNARLADGVLTVRLARRGPQQRQVPIE